MVRIDSQEQLKADLQSLQDKGFVQSNGPLERRGVEVDHTFYLPKENMTMAAGNFAADDESASPSPSAAAMAPRASNPASSLPAASAPEPGLLRTLQSQLDLMQSNVMSLQATLEKTQERLERIERELGLS
jgi:hypothetical protein